MSKSWAPADIQRLTITCSGCSCLVILVCCISFGAITGKISPQLLGNIKGVAVGGGLLGLAMILYMVIRASLPGSQPSRRNP
jgi:hypothetical protein